MVFLLLLNIHAKRKTETINVSLTSGLPGFKVTAKRARRPTKLSAPFPEKPGSRKAGKPKGREAERPGSRKAERAETREAGEGRKGRNADWAEVRPIRRNLVCVTLSYRYATMPYGMPRHSATWHLVLSPHYFPVKASRLPNPPTHHPTLTATF
jgi:hypothetical protein